MEDPVAVAAAHDAQESTPLLRGDINTTTNNHNDRRHETCHYYDDCDTPNWYWPWPAAYWAAIPVIFLAGLAVGPAMAMTSPLVKLLFCERGIPDLFKDKNRDHLLLSGDEKDCDSSEHSAAIAKFTGVFASLTSVLGKHRSSSSPPLFFFFFLYYPFSPKDRYRIILLLLHWNFLLTSIFNY